MNQLPTQQPVSDVIVQNALQADTEAIGEDLTDVRRPARIGLWVMLIGLGGFLLWATLAPLDEGVPTQGMVSIDTKRRAIQHLRGGIVDKVLVREGQFVKQGDLLMVLDSQEAKARFESARQQLAAYRENIIAQTAALEGLKAVERSRLEQLGLVNKELDGIRSLVKDGYAPAVQQMQLERSRADIQSALSDNKANQQRVQQAVLEIQHQIRAIEQQITATRDDFERAEIRSPADGQVVGLQVQSVGSVIQPAQKVMDIVPKQEALVLETRVAPMFIDRISVNDPVDVRFSSFARSPQLVVDGRVMSVSGDVLLDQATQMPYYLARVELTPDGLQALGGRDLHPGMPVEVIIKTGERTMLNYILHPLTKRVAASLKEE
jgi:protease secretion system membrane fusion protein